MLRPTLAMSRERFKQGMVVSEAELDAMSEENAINALIDKDEVDALRAHQLKAVKHRLRHRIAPRDQRERGACGDVWGVGISSPADCMVFIYKVTCTCWSTMQPTKLCGGFLA